MKWRISIEVFDERQDIGDLLIFIQFIEPLKSLLNLLCVVPQVMQEGAALWEYIHDEHFELVFLKCFSGIPGILVFQGLCYLPVQIGETCLNHDLPMI